MTRKMAFARAAAGGAAALALAAAAAGALLLPLAAAAQEAPRYELDPAWPQLPFGDRWLTGGLGGMCVGPEDHVFLLNRQNVVPADLDGARPAPAVIELDPEGRVVGGWGDRASLGDRLHDCHVAADGSLWIVAAGEGVVQRYARDGSARLQQIGETGQYDSSDGTRTGRPLNSDRAQFFLPAALDVDPQTGDIYVADGELAGGNARIAVLDAEGGFLRQWPLHRAAGEQDITPLPHCLRVSNDGLVYVCDRQADRIQVFDRTGRFVRNLDVAFEPLTPRGADRSGTRGTAVALAFSPDAEQRRLFVLNQNRVMVEVLDRHSGALLASFGGGPGRYRGQFTLPHGIGVDSAGNVYVAEQEGRRVQRFTPAAPARAQAAAASEWRHFGADAAFTRYSPLRQIDHDNVSDLEIVWRRPAADPDLRAAFPDLGVDDYLRSTPILVDGVLYAPNAHGLLEAFDPATGETIWRQSPFAATEQEAAGSSTRGAAFWTDGDARRLLLVRGGHLYALDADTGRRVPAFGLADQGRVDLDWEHELAGEYDWTGGPVVVGDVVVVAGTTGGSGDGGVVREAAPEDIRGYDVRTGELRWTFHVVPREGEFGADTWGDGSGAYSGDLGSWCCLTADEELGYVYVPLSAPTGLVYGGHRPGDNLFSDSLVALDAATGERVWHFQMVHHDVWEYDTVGPPTLGEITVDGRRIRAVMQPSKTAFLYVFDRATGEPVWPIEERPVPQSVVPGERTAPTQPFPTKPPPFDRQGVTVDDLIDFTPELRAAALAAVERLVLGPLFTPPWPRGDGTGAKLGTLAVPGGWGAGNWHTGAFDPETGIYYAVSHTMPTVWSVTPPDVDSATLDWAFPRGDAVVFTPRPHGLPIVKPPYGRITALDLNRGELAWMAANGDGPRNHPRLRDLDLPPLGIPNRPAPLVTGSLLFLGEGSDAILGILRPGGELTDPDDPEQDASWRWGKKFRAWDKATGEVVWETELPAGVTGAPMTYLHDGRQYIVVAVGARDQIPEWVALALP